MSIRTLYYNGKNREQVNMTIANLDPTKLHRLRIDEFDEKTREQEEKYHAMLGDIAEQMLHLTQTLDLDSWKRLCVAQFKADSIANDVPRLAEYWKTKQMRLMPSLDGKTLVALGDQTRDFPKYVAAGFIEWLNYYGAINGVKFKARDES
jgi:hypothetical protein